MSTLKQAAAVLVAAGAVAGTAAAAAPPVGPVPKGPVTKVSTQRGSLVAIALPHRANGLVWRLARGVNPTVLREVSEADVGSNVVIVYRAQGRGDVRVVYALTRGETRKAYASVTHVVHVG